MGRGRGDEFPEGYVSASMYCPSSPFLADQVASFYGSATQGLGAFDRFVSASIGTNMHVYVVAQHANGFLQWTVAPNGLKICGLDVRREVRPIAKIQIQYFNRENSDLLCRTALQRSKY